MAIKFLNGVDLNQNQLIAARVENLGVAPATPVEGQIYYDSTPGDQVIYFWDGTSWVSTADSGGTVTSVAQTHSGNAFSVSGSPITVGGTLAITVVGNSNQYINGAGNLTTFPSIPQGDITAIVAGSGMTGTSLSGPIPTLNVIGGTGITANADSIQIDYTGADNAILSATSRSIALTDSVWFNDSTDNVIGFDTVADLLALAPQGDITGVNGGTYITVANSTGPVPTVNHDSTTRTDTSSTQSPAFGSTFDVVTSVSTNSTGHVTAINESTVTLPAASFTSLTLAGSSGTNSTITNGNTISILAGSNISTTGNGTDGVTIAYTGGTGTMSSWTLSGDSGPSQTISNGNTVDIAGGTYATTVASATDRVTVNVDGTTAATASKLIARDGSGYGYVITPSSGDSSTKIATTAFVQASLTGLLEFKGGFNATTGAIVGGGNLTSGGTRVAVEVGDYYVVTVAGNFFGNASTPLTPGDSVIVQTAAAAGASVEGDFIVVQSDTDLATLSTVGIGNVNAGTGIGVVYSAGTATVSNTSPNIVQNLWSKIDADSGTTTANSPTDTLDIVGAGGVSTSISGDVLTITGASTYVLPQMTATTRGGAELFSNTVQSTAANSVTSTGSRTYGLQLNSANQLVVNVPWVNTNTQTVTSVDETTPGTSSGTPIVVNPTTGNVLVKSMAYAGTSNVGHVPAGGGSTTFLRGDGSWVVPTNTQGVTSIIASTANSRVGLTPTTSSTGAVTIGLNLTGLSAVTTPATTDTLPIYNASTNKKITVANLATAITDATSYAETITDTDLTIDHNLGTLDVIVQLYDVTTSENVFADISRISTNRIGVTFGATPTNSIRVLVQKVIS